MKRGTIPIDNTYELEYRYYDRDSNYKYFNRKFEVYLLEKKMLKKNYIMHMDNSDTREGNWFPFVYKAPKVNKQISLGVTTLNWNDMKNNFLEHVVDTIGEEYRGAAKKAVTKLSSPKI